MADGVSVKIEGIEEAVKKMATLEQKITRRVVTKAVRAGGSVILKAARQAVPVRSRSLSRALRQSIKMDRKTGTVSGKVGIDRKKKYATAKYGEVWPTKYMHLVTLGTKPHRIETKTKRALETPDGYVHSVQHPGSRGNDFLGHASRVSSSPAISAFNKRYGTEVEIEAAKS